MSEPSRVLAAAWDPKLISTGAAAPDIFTLKQEPLNFAGVKVESAVDVRATPVGSGGLALEGLGIESVATTPDGKTTRGASPLSRPTLAPPAFPPSLPHTTTTSTATYT